MPAIKLAGMSRAGSFRGNDPLKPQAADFGTGFFRFGSVPERTHLHPGFGTGLDARLAQAFDQNLSIGRIAEYAHLDQEAVLDLTRGSRCPGRLGCFDVPAGAGVGGRYTCS